MTKSLREKIIEILREIISASENRDWVRELHATKREFEIMRNNNDNDFLQIADQISALFAQEKKKLIHAHKILVNTILEEKEQEKQKWIKEIEEEIEKMSRNPKITNVGEIFFELSKLKQKVVKIK